MSTISYSACRPDVGELRNARWRPYAKGLIIGALCVGSYIGLLLFAHGPLVAMLLAGVLVIALIATSTSVMHDANHGSTVQWFLFSDFASLETKRVGSQPLRRAPRRRDVAMLFAGTLVHLGWAVVLPLMFHRGGHDFAEHQFAHHVGRGLRDPVDRRVAGVADGRTQTSSRASPAEPPLHRAFRTMAGAEDGDAASWSDSTSTRRSPSSTVSVASAQTLNRLAEPE